MDTEAEKEFDRLSTDTLVDHVVWNIEKIHQQSFFDQKSGKEMTFSQVTNSNWLVVLLGLLSYLSERNWTFTMAQTDLALKLGLPIREVKYWMDVFKKKGWILKGPAVWSEDEEKMLTVWGFTVGQPSNAFPDDVSEDNFVSMLRWENWL